MKNEIDFVPATALSQMVKGEIDQQIATAHQYPRSLELFNKRAMEMVSIDYETAESCIYRRPVGKGKDGNQKIVEGESIRLAEIVAACYGNIRIQSMIIEQTDRQIIARGMAHDLESNTAASSEVIESTVDKKGKPYSERMRVVMAKAALSKARRDATFMVVPKALCKSITNKAKDVIAKNEKPLSERIEAALKWTDSIDVPRAKVYETLNVKGKKDMGLDHLYTLTGLKTAIKESDITIQEAFYKATIKDPEPILSDEIKKSISDCKTIQEIQELYSLSPEFQSNMEFNRLISDQQSKLS